MNIDCRFAYETHRAASAFAAFASAMDRAAAAFAAAFNEATCAIGPVVAHLAIALARTTVADFTTAADRLRNQLAAGRMLTASQIRFAARTLGTSDHFGESDGPAIPVRDLIEAARTCDEPFAGGDFSLWLFLEDGDDW